ncbi:MAG: nitroreductase family protein, partial [Myxococcales bacterium]|nr:nitroreductase family protein [Myxococcales bacterium]
MLNLDLERELRLAPTVQFRLGGDDWRAIELVAGEGDRRVQATLDEPAIVRFLLALRRPVRVGAALELAEAELGHQRQQALGFIAMLEERGVLVAANAPNPYASEAAQRWIRWGWRDALDYHLSVRNMRFSSGDAEGMAEQVAALGEQLRAAHSGAAEPSPGPYKDYPDAPRIALPKSREQIDAATVGRALYKRRTCRKFNGRTLDKAVFAELMQHSFGLTSELDLGDMGPHVRRTTPSGGARHPVEVYAVVFRVEDVAPGLYHYSVREHGLEQLREGDFSQQVYHLGHQQTGLQNVSAALFFTARWDR